MKIKAKMNIPMWDSYCGLDKEDWEALNDGESVEVDSIPEAAKPYLMENKQKISKKGKE